MIRVPIYTVSGVRIKGFGIGLDYRHTYGAGVTLRLSRNVGVNIRRMRGSDHRWYLCAIGWYPKGRHRLGYFQLSCPAI